MYRMYHRKVEFVSIRLSSDHVHAGQLCAFMTVFNVFNDYMQQP